MRGSVAVLALGLAACSRGVERPVPARSGDLDTYLLRVRVSGNGEVSVGRLGDRCADDCTYHVQRGKTVTLTAAGKEDVFHTWSDRCASDASCTIKMASNVSIRADFGLDRYELTWAIPVTTTACTEVTGVAVADRVVISGDLQGDAALGHTTLTSGHGGKAFVAALERSSGDVVWATALDDASFATTAPSILTSGRVLAAETITRRGVGDTLVWLDGDTGRLLGSTPVADQVGAIEPLTDGGFVVLADGGTSVARFGPAVRSPAWTQQLARSRFGSGDGLAATARGDLVVAGREPGIPRFAVPLSGVAPPATHGAFLVRLDAGTGILLGGRWLDWSGLREVTGIALHGPIVVLSGIEVSPRPSAFVAALSIDGNPLWEHVYGLDERMLDVSIRSVARSREGVAMAGSTSDILDLGTRRIGKRGQETAFLAELSPTGEVVWTYAWPIAHGRITAIAVDRDDDLYVTGTFMEALELGARRIEPANTNERCTSSFVARFTRTGDRSPGRGL